MKMVKSLLLVSAAGLVAVSGAQAADLPVKAKPVEYVKVCSLYGAGFYYIPGTDICMKIGGYVRYQIDANTASITSGPFAGGNAFNTRLAGQDFAQRVRAVATFDTRQQTAYGTLRTYLLIGYTQDTNANAGLNATAGQNTPLYATRAFIQLAGFTFGKATSFFDFVSIAAVAYNAGFTYTPDTGDGGQIVGSYTAQFGNGVSGTFGIEQSRRNNTFYANAATSVTALTNAAFTGNNLGNSVANTSVFPDFVGNLRIDQAWGSAQISGAVHDASAGYYGNGIGGATVNEINGHPNNKWGYAVSAGLRLNAPMIGPGDYFQVAGVYSEGAVRYASSTNGAGGIFQRWTGNQFAVGHFDDSSFGGNNAGNLALGGTTNNGLNLTTAWSVFASYEHFWTPALRTSLYGSYLGVSQNDTAKAQWCANATTVVNGGGAGFAGTQAGCSPNWSSYNVGTRSQWNITKDLYVGVDVIYSRLNSATVSSNPVFLTAANLGAAATAGKPAGVYNNSDLDAVSTTWRIHRDIVP